MGCGASVESTYTVQEQIWAKNGAPGRVELSRVASVLERLPGGFPGRPADLTPEQVLQLRSSLAHELSTGDHPFLENGGRARSYGVDAVVVAREVRNTVAGYEAPVEELTHHAYPDNVGLTSPPKSFSKRSLWGTHYALVAAVDGGHQDPAPSTLHKLPPTAPLSSFAAAAVPPPVRNPHPLMMVCPPPDQYAKPAFGALPSFMVQESVAALTSGLRATWEVERSHEVARADKERATILRRMAWAFVALRDSAAAAKEQRRDEVTQQTQVWYRALKKQSSVGVETREGQKYVIALLLIRSVSR